MHYIQQNWKGTERFPQANLSLWQKLPTGPYHALPDSKNQSLDLNLHHLFSQVGTQFLQIFTHNTQKGCNPNRQVPKGITVLVFHIRRHEEVESYSLHRPGGSREGKSLKRANMLKHCFQRQLKTSRAVNRKATGSTRRKLAPSESNFSLSWASYAWKGFNKVGELNIQTTYIWRNDKSDQETLTRIFKNKNIMQTCKTNNVLVREEGKHAGWS